MMSRRDQDILTSNRLLLVRQLKVTEDLLSCLLVDYTLTGEMKQEIEAERTESRRAGTLIDTLMRRGDKAFDRLLNALVQTDQDGLARSLDYDKAEMYIESRNISRQINGPPSNALGHFQNQNPSAHSQGFWPSGPFPNHQQLQQFMTQFMLYSATNPVGFPMSTSLTGSLVAQPNDVEIRRDDITDSRLEEETALAEINGVGAKGEMIIRIQPAMNLHRTNSHDVYKMNHLPRGRVLIINNHYFLGSNLAARAGAQYDKRNLKELFEKLSFKVEIVENRSAEQMVAIVEQESKNPFHQNADMFILFILSHGSQGNVYGSDGKKISIEGDITRWFSPENCAALAGKPKIFFIQACQGELTGRVFELDSDQREALSDEDQQLQEKMADLKLEDKRGFVPGYFNKSDIVMSYATVKGYLAWRRTDLGSWFVRCLVNVFARRVHSEHLLDMLTEVNSLLSKLKTSEAEGRLGQLAEKSDTLTKKLYFFPGADARADGSLTK